jgi:intergrase/recombinase
MNKEDIQKVLDHRKKELHDFAPDLYKVLYDISTFHSLKTDWEREELFHKVEKEVLADLPENIRDKITGRRKLLDEKDDKYQKDYREFIVLLYTKEIFLTPKEALFT